MSPCAAIVQEHLKKPENDDENNCKMDESVDAVNGAKNEKSGEAKKKKIDLMSPCAAITREHLKEPNNDDEKNNKMDDSIDVKKEKTEEAKTKKTDLVSPCKAILREELKKTDKNPENDYKMDVSVDAANNETNISVDESAKMNHLPPLTKERLEANKEFEWLQASIDNNIEEFKNRKANHANEITKESFTIPIELEEDEIIKEPMKNSIGTIQKKDMMKYDQNNYKETQIGTNHSNLIREETETTAMVTRQKSKQIKEKESKNSGGLVSSMVNVFSSGVSSVMNTLKKKETNDGEEPHTVDDTQEELVDTLFESFLLSKGQDDLVIRFHVVLAPEFEFNIEKDQVLLKGLNHTSADPWTGGIEMEAKKKVQGGFVLLVGYTKLPLAFRGRMLEYKYFVTKGDKGLFEDLELRYSHDTVNRALTIPEHFSKDFFDQYDDVILMKNSKREEYREVATRAFLPSFRKIMKRGDYHSLQEKVEKFRRIIHCHTSGILFVKDYGKGWNYSYRQPRASLYAYDFICNKIVDQWVSNLFANLTEIQNAFSNSNEEMECRELLKPLVYGSLFYFLLQEAVHKNLPDISKENLRILVSSLAPMICNGSCLKLETVRLLLETPAKREAIAEAFEEGINQIVKYKHFQENPTQILQLLPTVHFLRGCFQPVPLKSIMEKEKSAYWGFFKISISVLKAFKSLKHSEKGALFCYEQMRTNAQVDAILPYSFLRCLSFEEFISLLNNEGAAQFFQLPSIIAASLTYLHKDEVSKVDPTILLTSLRNYVMQRLSQSTKSKELITLDTITELELIVKSMFARLAHNVTESKIQDLIVGLQTVVVSYKFIFDWYSLKKEELNTNIVTVGAPLQVISQSVVNIIHKIFKNKHQRLKKMILTLSEVGKVFEPLKDYMMIPIMDKVIEELETSKNQEIVDCYTDMDVDALVPFIKQALEENTLKIAETEMKTWGGWLKEKVGWSDGSKIKFATLYAKALGSCVKDLNFHDKNAVMSFALKNEVLDAILQQEKKSKDWLKTYFPVKEDTILTKVLKYFVEYLQNAVKGDSTIGMLRTIREASEQVLKLRIDVSNSMFDKQIHYDCFQLLDLREEEVLYFLTTTREIVRFLQCFNGKVDNFSSLIETYPNDEELLLLNHSSICNPRAQANEEISLRIDQFDVRDMQLIKQFLIYQESTVFRDIIDDLTEVLKKS